MPVWNGSPHYSKGHKITAALECLEVQDDSCDIKEEPLNLSGMKKKIDRGLYSSVHQMGDDLRALCGNVRVSGLCCAMDCNQK